MSETGTSDEAALEGALVPAPAEQIRYEEEDPGKVTRVFVRVDYAGGRVREYEAREPQDFKISNPDDMPTMSFRQTRLSIGGPGGFRGLTAGVPTLSVSFAANPRRGLDIRTERTAGSWPGRSAGNV
jgi:hypothetical protein